MDDQPLKLQPACMHLRHKMMYVHDEQKRPGLVDDQSDTRVFWCDITKDALGHDGKIANPEVCDASRACFCQAPESRVSLRTSD